MCQALLDEPDEGYFLGCACSLTYIAERTQLEPHSAAPSTTASSGAAAAEPEQGRGVTGVRPQGTVQVSQADRQAGSQQEVVARLG